MRRLMTFTRAFVTISMTTEHISFILPSAFHNWLDDMEGDEEPSITYGCYSLNVAVIVLDLVLWGWVTGGFFSSFTYSIGYILHWARDFEDGARHGDNRQYV